MRLPHNPPLDTAPQPRPTYDAGDYLAMLRRGWWLLLAATLLALLGAAGVTALQTKVYEATTSVLVLPSGMQDTDLAGGRTRNQINLDTEAQLVSSNRTAALAKRALKTPEPADELREAVTVTVPPNTAVLQITYAAGDPATARDGSQAFAEAYLRNRKESAETELKQRIEAVEKQIKGVRKQLRAVTSDLDARPAATGDSYLAAERQNLTAQLNTLTNRLGELRATPVTGGRIISDAQLPTAPSRPVPLLNLAAGLMLGLVLGVAAVLARQFLDRRVQRGADVVRRAGVPLLVELPDRTVARSAPTADGAFGAFTPAGRVFSRLRNEVAASLEPGEPAVVVVTGARRGPAAPTLAANLAVAFTRAGNSVALVYADIPGAWADGPVRRFGVPATPGLSDVLAERVELDEALCPAARYPGLRVLPTGSTASAAGLLRPEPVRRVLRSLRHQVEYVIVHAPSTAESADAQSLAIHADAVILAVDLRRTTDLEVADAAEQLHRVGTPLLGAVALAPPAAPKSGRATTPAPTPEPGRSGTKSERAGTDSSRSDAKPGRPRPKPRPDAAADSKSGDPTPAGTDESPAAAGDSPTLVLPRLEDDTDRDGDGDEGGAEPVTAEPDDELADFEPFDTDSDEPERPDRDQLPASAAPRGRR